MPKTVNQIIPVEPAKINKDALEKLLAAVKQIECANPSDANTVRTLLNELNQRVHEFNAYTNALETD